MYCQIIFPVVSIFETNNWFEFCPEIIKSFSVVAIILVAKLQFRPGKYENHFSFPFPSIFNNKTPFLDITNRVHKPLFPGDERGLLGFTFDPDYNDNGYFYVNYVNKDDYTIVSRFSSKNKLADDKTEKIIVKK